MNALLLNVLLAVTWAALIGEFTVPALVAGFIIGFIALLVAQPLVGPVTYPRKTWQVITFTLFFLKELVQANLRIALEVVTPGYHMTPGVVAIPLEDLRDVEITLLANLITLTPGTLSLDVSDDRRTLYIHAMYVTDPEAVRREVKEGFERRVMEVMR